MTYWHFARHALLVVVVADLALGGNGYLFRIAGFRLREILLALCLAWVLIGLLKGEWVKFPRFVIIVTTVFAITTTLGLLIGLMGGYQPDAILAELKPLAYFPMLLFFVAAIREPTDVLLVAKVLIACGVAVGTIYVATIVAAWIGLTNYFAIYETLVKSDEFIFRTTPTDSGSPFVGFFYKGMFYTAVAALVLIFGPFGRVRGLAGIALFAVTMTGTRGLVASLLLAAFAGCIIDRKWSSVALFLGGSVLIAGVLAFALRSETQSLTDEPARMVRAGSVIATSASLITPALGTLELPVEKNVNIKVDERLHMFNTGTYPPSKAMSGHAKSYFPQTGILKFDVDQKYGNDSPDNYWIIVRATQGLRIPDPATLLQSAYSQAIRAAKLGEISFPIAANLNLQAGQEIRIQNASVPSTIVMSGTVKTYTRSLLVAEIKSVAGPENVDNFWIVIAENIWPRELPVTIATQSPKVPSGPEKRGKDFAMAATNLEMLGGSRGSGDRMRLADIGDVWLSTTATSALVGHGLGAPIGGRNRIEMNYAEIFHKQGLLGLVVWIMLFIEIVRHYRLTPTPDKRLALAFVSSTIFVYIVTATNTFLTGSIGMAVVFMAYSSLSVLSHRSSTSGPSSERW